VPKHNRTIMASITAQLIVDITDRHCIADGW